MAVKLLALLAAQPQFTPREIPGTDLETVDLRFVMRLEGLNQLKNEIITSESEHMTFGLAYCTTAQ
jgi:hypothetical protein